MRGVLGDSKDDEVEKMTKCFDVGGSILGGIVGHECNNSFQS